MSDSKIYREGDKLIKVYLSAPYEYAEQAYQRQKFVYEAGLPIPAVFGIKKISDTETALEMEYIEGKPLVSMYEGKSEEMLTEAMRVMVKLQCRMNAIDASDLPDLTDFYVHEITMTPYLTTPIKETLLALMKSLDKGKTNLCHGDIHPYNIMFNGKESWIIDWEDASKGDPAADACMSYFYSLRWSAKDKKDSAEQYMQLFCEESGIAREEVLAWLPVIAGVQVNIENDEDRAFISKFIDDWYMNRQRNNMEIKYIPDGAMTEKQQKDVDIINQTCLSGDPNEPEEEFDINTYEWSAPEDGMFLLFDGERAVGRVAVHKTLTEYNEQDYYLGGFGGLAVLPEYQGKGYGRKLAEAALEKSYEIGVDVACMSVNMESSITAFYEKLGFVFLNRSVYFINHGNNEVTDDKVMIMGLNNKRLAEKILNTTHKFHYGKNKGHW